VEKPPRQPIESGKVRRQAEQIEVSLCSPFCHDRQRNTTY
jgi:hypothetical protein